MNNVFWFPMRVTYGRELKVRQYLDTRGIECFLPMCHTIVERGGDRFRKLVPAVRNLIFVRDTRERITYIKQNEREAASLRYMMTRPTALSGGNPEIITVPDRQMESFMRVARAEDERVMFLDIDKCAGKKGIRVRVIDGVFAGVEGVVKRIDKNKRVVVEIKGVAAVAITFVPRNYLQVIEDEG